HAPMSKHGITWIESCSDGSEEIWRLDRPLPNRSFGFAVIDVVSRGDLNAPVSTSQRRAGNIIVMGGDVSIVLARDLKIQERLMNGAQGRSLDEYFTNEGLSLAEAQTALFSFTALRGAILRTNGKVIPVNSLNPSQIYVPFDFVPYFDPESKASFFTLPDGNVARCALIDANCEIPLEWISNVAKNHYRL
ncbi:MAG: hypothetical protein KDD53_07725, partial [Bdellovibrionales bacterium]|nr:hypothetical protein [Bdellovibrionales bacterium]